MTDDPDLSGGLLNMPKMTGVDSAVLWRARTGHGQHRVSAGGTAIDIAPTEYRLLHFFMTHADRAFSRSQLLDQVWGNHVYVEERTVDVHVRRLRRALEQTGHEHLLQTVRGVGYRFSDK